MCFFFQAEDGIRDYDVTGVQTCALPIFVDHVELEESLIKGLQKHVEMDAPEEDEVDLIAIQQAYDGETADAPTASALDGNNKNGDDKNGDDGEEVSDPDGDKADKDA